MSKRPPLPGRPSFAPPPRARPTVALPASAIGGGAPGGGTNGGTGARAVPNDAALREALRAAGAHFAAGRTNEAAAVARQVLRLQPRQADAHHLLGLVAFHARNFAEAERLIGAAIALSRPNPNLLVNLGNAQRRQNKLDRALVSYAGALRLDPTYMDAHEARLALLAAEERYDEALAAAETLIGLYPDDPHQYLHAATIATEGGRFRDALAIAARALARFEPPPATLVSLTALAHERLTELPEAISWAEKTLALAPANGAALQTWAKAKRRLAKGEAQALRDIRVRLEAAGIEAMPAPDARILYSELGQICDALGEADAAFDYFTRQNEQTAEAARQRGGGGVAFLAEVDGLLDVFTPDFAQGWAGGGERCEGRAAPAFLIGFPRSGTTLLDQILDAHPDVRVIEERPLLRAAKLAAEALGYPRKLPDFAAPDLDRLRTAYWEALAREGVEPDGRLVVDKMPLNIVHVGLIKRIFPDARIVLALRHPADCVLSCFMQDFVANRAMANFLTLEGTARLYDRTMTLWQRYRDLLPLDVVEVRYENLVRDLRGEVEPVVGFLGLSWNEVQGDPAAHALRRGSIRTPSYSQVTQPIYASAAERWRRYQKHLAPVLPVLEKHIHAFGYMV